MSRLSDRLKLRERMGRVDFRQEAGRFLMLVALMALTWYGGFRGLAPLVAQGPLLSGLPGALFAAVSLLLVTVFLARSGGYGANGLCDVLQALLVFICTGTGFVHYQSLLGPGAGVPFLLTDGLALAMGAIPPLLLLIHVRAIRERTSLAGKDEAPVLPLQQVLGRLGGERLPSRAALHDALVWYEGAPHLVVPVTGPYERARARYVEDLISLTHVLTDHGYAKPARALSGTKGAREAVRAFRGTSASWPFRQRYAFFRLDERVVTQLLGQGDAAG